MKGREMSFKIEPPLSHNARQANAIRYKYMIIQSLLGYIPSHSHEDSLGSQLKRPKSNFLKASLTCLFINDITSKRIVYLMG
jgi:hypothetical protein